MSLLGKIKQIKEQTTPEELVGIALGCPAIKPQQLSSEFVELAKLVKAQQCKHLLEIGTYRGGTLFVFSQVAEKDATIISVDYSMTILGFVYRAGQWPLFRKFIRKGQSLLLLRKDSHQAETLTGIERFLQGHKLDFLFIDGDHTYQGVRKDFEMYSPLVRSGGLVAFHDITPSGDKEVYKFWAEVKNNYTYKEFIHRTGEDAMGIGVLWL